MSIQPVKKYNSWFHHTMSCNVHHQLNYTSTVTKCTTDFFFFCRHSIFKQTNLHENWTMWIAFAPCTLCTECIKHLNCGVWHKVIEEYICWNCRCYVCHTHIIFTCMRSIFDDKALTSEFVILLSRNSSCRSPPTFLTSVFN